MFDSDLTHAEAWEGYGSGSLNDIQGLMKALEAQEGITDVANLQGVGALQPQSLEGMLALLTFQEKHLQLFKDVPKSNAFSTLEEYSVQTGYGHEGGWVGQMESPLEADPQAKREYATVKFLRQMWKISDVSGIVTTIRETEVWAKQAASLRALRDINRSLYTGDSDMVPEQIDGFKKAILGNGSTDHIKDLRGVAPVQSDFREIAELIVANFGTAEGAGLYCSPGGMTTIDKIMENNGGTTTQRIIQGNADQGLTLGYAVDAIKTSFGKIIPKTDIFLASEFEGKGVPVIQDPTNPTLTIEGATSVRSPMTPTIAVTTQAAPVAGSKWAGTGVRPSGVVYNYRVAARNRFGYSAACAAGFAGAVVAAGGSNTITITPAVGSLYPETSYEIYSEQVAGSGNFKFMARVKRSTGATTAYVDKNEDIPGTTSMFLLDLTSVGEMRSFSLARLAPLHSVEFAKIGMYRWGTVNLYCTPKYYAPRRFAMLKNVPVGLVTKNNLIEV